jgi:transcriptional regulator with XRE-family HTH domain
MDKMRLDQMPQCNGDLRKLRLEAGLSQNKLARAADLDRATISSAERGGEVTDLTLSKLAAALSKALGTAVPASQLQK